MKSFTEEIDAYYQGLYPDFFFYGLAELTTKSKDRFPVTVNGREKVCLHDDYDCLVWHREMSVSQIENEELAFGMDIPVEFQVRLRTIVGYKIALGEEFKYDFANAFPKDLDKSGYEKLEAIPGTMEVDREKVAREEEIHIQYEKLLCWNLFWFENTFQFVLCPETSP
jgi:hypothetical protein